jgi:hypothetical protein
MTTATVIKLPLAEASKKRSYADRWSASVMKLGYTPLPNLLLHGQAKLRLTPMQLNVLLQLAGHWWEADKAPFLAKDTIARRMGRTPRQVQRYITQLEKAGFVKRIARYRGYGVQTANGYSLDGLVKKLKAIEPEFTKIAEQNRLRRKKVEASSGGGT